MKFSKTHAAILALVIANIIWGATAPILKWSLADIEPFTLAFLRFFIACLIILPFTLHKLKIQKKDIFFIILLAFIGFNIHIGSFLWGLKLAPSINAPIIGSAAPIFIIIGSIAFLREKINKKVILGAGLSLLGVITIVLRPFLEDHANGMVTGNLFLVIGTIAVVAYTLMLKKIDKSYSALTLTFWTFAIASLFFLPPAVWELEANNIFVTGIGIKGLIGILYGALLSSLTAYLLFTYALKKIPASKVGVSLYIDPVVAILIAVPLLGETLTPAYILGSALVFIGIFIAEGRIHYHPIKKLKEIIES